MDKNLRQISSSCPICQSHDSGLHNHKIRDEAIVFAGVTLLLGAGTRVLISPQILSPWQLGFVLFAACFPIATVFLWRWLKS